MNFLNTRREAPQQSSRETECKRQRKETKAAVLDDEISHFFMSTEAPRREHKHNKSHLQAGRSPPRSGTSAERQYIQSSSTPVSSAPVVSLPPRPFLGFGEPGPRPDNSQSRSSRTHNLSSRKPRAHRSSTLETIYLPWSTSPNRPHPLPKMRKTDEQADSPSKRANDKTVQPQKLQDQQSVRGASTSAQPQVDKSTNRIEDEDPEETKVQGDLCKRILNPSTSCPGGHSENLSSGNNESGITGLPSMQDMKSADAVESTKQDTLSQFTVAINELLDKWKDKVSVPTEIIRCVQKTAGTGRPESQSSSKHDDDHPQETTVEDIIKNKEDPQHVQTPRSPSQPMDNPACIAKPDDAVDRGPVPSRHTTSSRISLVGQSATALQQPHIRISSPFHDSSYSTYRGTESIYEQQMHGYQQLPGCARDTERNRSGSVLTSFPLGVHDSPHQPSLTRSDRSMLGGNYDSSSTIYTNRYWDTLGLDLPQSTVTTTAESHSNVLHGNYEPLIHASPSIYVDEWRSPLGAHHSIKQQPSAFSYQDILRDCVPEDTWQDMMLREEDLGNDFGLQGRPLGAHDGGEELGFGAEENGEMEIEPSGFWKPNLLY